MVQWVISQWMNACEYAIMYKNWINSADLCIYTLQAEFAPQDAELRLLNCYVRIKLPFYRYRFLSSYTSTQILPVFVPISVRIQPLMFEGGKYFYIGNMILHSQLFGSSYQVFGPWRVFIGSRLPYSFLDWYSFYSPSTFDHFYMTLTSAVWRYQPYCKRSLFEN